MYTAIVTVLAMASPFILAEHTNETLLLEKMKDQIVAQTEFVHDGMLTSAKWAEYKQKYKKVYTSEDEEEKRFFAFMNNLKNIHVHHLLYQSGHLSYQLGINEYSDLKPEEFVAKMNGLIPRNSPKHQHLRTAEKLHRVDYMPPLVKINVPDSVDWRKEGYVTEVKNQGQCGSCWSFSATGALEGQLYRKTGKLVSLSEQNLVDCSQQWGNNGCNGGLMDYAFQYVKDNHGIDTELSYPYVAEDEPKCLYNKSDSAATDLGYVDVVPSGDENMVKQALATQGPISIAIDASQPSFQLYHSGIYSDPQCSSTELDHGVLLVGYGSTYDGMDYWIVKNSWGESWGEGGYVRIKRNGGNMCGVATQASYPIM